METLVNRAVSPRSRESPHSPPRTEGAFFETQIACLWHRFIHQQGPLPAQRLALGYYRDYNQREVDFILRDKQKIFLAVECKLSERDVPHLAYFTKAFAPAESVLLVEEPGIFQIKGIHAVVSAEFFASVL